MGNTSSTSTSASKWQKVSSAIVKAAATATNPTTDCVDPAQTDSASSTKRVCGCPVTLKKSGNSCTQGTSNKRAVCVKCNNGLSMSQWWLETNSVVGGVIENVKCNNIRVGTTNAHFVGQSPCCMVSRMASNVADLFSSNEFTEKEKTAFWAYLVGDDTQTINWTDKKDIESAFNQYVQISCDGVGDSNNQISTTDVNNLLLGVDSSITCGEMNVAVSETSQNVVCVINGFHAAQCKMDPSSCKAPPKAFVMPTYGWVLIGLAAVMLLLFAASLLHAAFVRHNRLLSGSNVMQGVPVLDSDSTISDELSGRIRGV